MLPFAELAPDTTVTWPLWPLLVILTAAAGWIARWAWKAAQEMAKRDQIDVSAVQAVEQLTIKVEANTAKLGKHDDWMGAHDLHQARLEGPGPHATGTTWVPPKI